MKCLDCLQNLQDRHEEYLVLNAEDIHKPLGTKTEILDIQNSFLIMNIHTAQNRRYKDRKGKETTK
jgi:hypothetical protein